jgi:hypothetical protein
MQNHRTEIRQVERTVGRTTETGVDASAALLAGSLLFVMLVWLAIACFCGLFGYVIAANKGRGALGFFLGVFFGPLGLIVAALLTPIKRYRY